MQGVIVVSEKTIADIDKAIVVRRSDRAIRGLLKISGATAGIACAVVRPEDGIVAGTVIARIGGIAGI